MPGYLNQTGNSIGSLLRFIQEQKSQSPIVPPSTDVGSPIRDVVQQPLSGSEGQGTSKVVSLRPEGTLTPSGQPVEQGAAQGSRVGPISIGGQGDISTAAPTQIVAANEPGSGFTIPSASRTVGDVLNRTGAASGPPISPGLGTKITPTTREGLPTAVTSRGSSTENYNRVKSGLDQRSASTEAAITAGERSIPETAAKVEDLYNRSQDLQKELTAQDQELLNRPLEGKALEELRAKRDAIIARMQAAEPTPTPTPAPSQGGGGGGVSRGGGSTGQVLGASTGSSSKSSGPGLSYSTPNPPKITYGKAPAVNIQQAIASGGLSKPVAPAPAPKAPSIGTIIGGGALQALKKLFGR